MSIFSNFFLIKNYEKNENFYRAHEKFATDKLNYKKNIKSNMVMPHGDIIAVDYCNKIDTSLDIDRILQFCLESASSDELDPEENKAYQQARSYLKKRIKK